MPKDITITVYTFKELLERAEKAEDGKKGQYVRNAVEKAREWLREGATMHNWWEYTYNDWKDALPQIGFDEPDISFSGFWSQGDGASFTCKYVDMRKLVEFLSNPPEASDKADGIGGDWKPYLMHRVSGIIKLTPECATLPLDDISASVTRFSNAYVHWNTCRFEAEFVHDLTDEQQRLVDEISASAEKLRQDICHAIYKDLEEEHDYQTSDEQLIEMAEANEYTFDGYGKRLG